MIEHGHPLRFGRTRAEVQELALVLASAGIENRIERARGGWRLVVAPDDEAEAAATLDDYARERPSPAPEPAEAPAYGETHVGFVLAALLLLFFVVTGPADRGSAWSRAGSGAAERILGGEPWRAVTALTLHADAAHVLGNAVACAVFVTAVARELGPGLGGALVLVAGTAGNVLNAYLRGARHNTVGASTAVFAAIGMLGGLQFGRKRGRRRAWLPIAGSLALLALLGTGERSDLTAHLFGLVAGLIAGAAASTMRPPRRAVQAGLGVAALLVVVGAWLMAFSRAR